ncbi:suppressor of fused domain protein [Phytomonospora endophytica]|uniref:Suppressor of fused-like domain-containing protein n=1 Tax=Phytomonospora endophytica TaxID=714109 RepID=A0A841FA73_9ACTN|nr:suppressor of fused domain protein [Phytomonospora endophytica]MBB6032185.1 hypothetical protein [Phytomonospora endophytica]GIG68534.1 hypothetical protein Pen01_48290 [Phytomonospora endophytica]
MGAAPILSAVWRERQARWGPEDDAYTYEGGGSPLDRVDVFVYRADAKTAMTTFATIGMAVREMPGDGGRAELHCTVRGPVPREVEGLTATLLANLGGYPWSVGAPLGWGHMVSLPGDFPGFPGCAAVFLSGPVTPDGWAWIDAGEERVRVLNVVPITSEERALAREYPPEVFFAELSSRTDVFSPRA